MQVGSEQQPVTTKEEAALAGEYTWKFETSGPMVDFELLELKADGTYEARVESTLVNPEVQCIHAPCTLHEDGQWSLYKASGEDRLRVQPSAGAARIYGVTVDAAGAIELSRGGSETTLFPL
jgi:hypothetical protein